MILQLWDRPFGLCMDGAGWRGGSGSMGSDRVPWRTCHAERQGGLPEEGPTTSSGRCRMLLSRQILIGYLIKSV